MRLLLIILGVILSCNPSNPKPENIREPAVAGLWYPANKDSLKIMIQELLNNVQAHKGSYKIYGIIAPHAGYVFSGKTAAYAFKQLESQEFKTIIILGPYHGPKRNTTPRVTEKGVSVYIGKAYRTPLGLANIDVELAQKIIQASDVIKFIPEAHIDEHSVEAEIPFLQSVLRDFKIVPIVMIDQSFETCRIVADAIANTIGDKKVLLVASSDFYHGNDYKECKKSTDESATLIGDYDIEGFHEAFQNRNAACGGGPITVSMLVCKELGANEIIPLHITNSGDVTGRTTGWIVGYGSFLVCQELTSGTNKGGTMEWDPLDAKTQKELLRITRATIETYVKTRKVPVVGAIHELPLQLREKRGVFVTLRTKDGRLRGCIGHHEADTPLYQLVPKMAIAAATQDYRFPPVSESELKSLEIKLSVYLCEVHKIPDAKQYEPGVHGIIMRKGVHASTFLPEVPVEEGWTREETFRHLCLKAGLPADAWKQETEFYVYKTQVFGE